MGSRGKMDPGLKFLLFIGLPLIAIIAIAFIQVVINQSSQELARAKVLEHHKALASTVSWIQEKAVEIARQDSTLKAGRLSRKVRRDTVAKLAQMRADMADSVAAYNARMDGLGGVLADSAKLPPGLKPLPRRF